MLEWFRLDVRKETETKKSHATVTLIVGFALANCLAIMVTIVVASWVGQSQAYHGNDSYYYCNNGNKRN